MHVGEPALARRVAADVLAWLMADGIVPIVGVSTPEQLDEAVGATRLTLHGEVRARLDAPC